MRTPLFLSLLTASMGMIQMAQAAVPVPATTTYNLPQASGAAAEFHVIQDKNKKAVVFDATDLDILSEEVCACCCPEMMKEVGVVRNARELEVRVGNLSPNIIIDDIRDIDLCEDTGKVSMVLSIKAVHPAPMDSGLPTIDVPIFFTAMDIPSQTVYKQGHAVARIDLNKPGMVQRVKVNFDASDLKARGLKGWSLLTGIIKSEANFKYEDRIERSVQQKIAQAGGAYDIDSKSKGPSVTVEVMPAPAQAPVMEAPVAPAVAPMPEAPSTVPASAITAPAPELVVAPAPAAPVA